LWLASDKPKVSLCNHQQVSALKPVCPACLSADTSLKFQVSSEQAAQAFVQVQEQRERNLKLRSHIEQLWDAAACEIRSCAICGFGFAWPFVAGDDTFYNLAYPKVGYPSMKWEFQRTLRALERVNLGTKSVLEVGAGYGFFLDLLREGGMPASNIEAIEYNLDSIDRLRSRGYTAISHDMRSSVFDSRASAFEYIFLFQVVEHMADLDALFSRLRFLLKPGGSIFISVPNVRQIDYQEAHKSLIDMPPNHVGRWTVQAFKAISFRNGLDLVANLAFSLEWTFTIATCGEHRNARPAYRAAREVCLEANFAERLRPLPSSVVLPVVFRTGYPPYLIGAVLVRRCGST
jgi:2-polyprenyl-3-methyl-5-hydroxy-6-metoxy-1,4-benzoquinol methylase